MVTQPFLRIEEVVFAPPWPAVVAVAIVCGLASLGLQLARRVRAEPSVLDAAAGFIAAIGATAAVAQAMALGGVASVGLLQALAGLLVASSAGLLRPHSRSWLRRKGAAAAELARGASRVERWLLGGSVLTVAALGLASLGPPTDIDTLAYHLSVPLDWLAHGGAEPVPFWLHARLVGAGEALNLLGLAAGSDCLGATLQAAGLAAVCVAVCSLAATASNRILSLAIVAGCPVAIYLSLTAKPQLLPAAATAIALALFVDHRRAFGHLSIPTLWALFTCTAFAVACKYTFILGGAAVSTLVFWSVWNTRWRRPAFVAAIVTFLVIALPVFVRNLVFYGDPLSPMLEPLRAEADPAVAAFRWYLRNFAGDHALDRLLRLPWTLVVPTDPGHLTTVLGLGALAGLTIPARRWQDWDVLAAAAAVVGISLLGQLQARFFFEPYLWFAVVAAATPWTSRKRLLAPVLGLQMLVTLPVATYGTARLFPAALSGEAREGTLVAVATDYRLSRWLDEVLPPDAVIATDRHASLFAPRRATHADYLRMLGYSPDSASTAGRAANMVALSGASFAVVTEPIETSPLVSLITEPESPAFTSPVFRDASRNPWREGPAYRVRVYRLAGGRPSRP